jgi:predicted RecB family endonuclease
MHNYREVLIFVFQYVCLLFISIESIHLILSHSLELIFRKQSKFNNKQNDQLNKLKNDFEEMKTKVKRQDEMIEHLRQQLEKKDTTAPPPSSPSS